MAKRELKVVVSKKSEKEIQKAIDKINETGAAVYGLELDEEDENGRSVSILKILIEV